MVIDRRMLLAGLASAALAGRACANSGARPTIGAIRWDAWYTQSATDGIRSVVQNTLSPTRWQGRAPSCAVVDAPDAISLDKCGVQSRIDIEIVKAHTARIDYWAYCWFGADHPMQRAWRLHQSSPNKTLVKWCCIFSYEPFVRQVTCALPELVGLLTAPNYQTVLDGRPLLFMLTDDTKPSVLSDAIRGLRRECQRSGRKNPYVVLMLWSPLQGGGLAATGADAVSAYATMGEVPIAGSYTELVTIAEAYWKVLADSGQAIVPTAMTGWDTRPRQETPTPWPTTGLGPSGEEHYYLLGSAHQVAAHVHNMSAWIRTHPQSCPAQTGIIYSWDEHDEGGSVLNSTIVGGDSILDAVGQALK
ncbi:hypothetical protein [Rhodoblastus sp.]|uniref:hypothetical protein n=1 Tax=Rhodoblastus sp. TaxID=1962975 RepID=UPI0025FB172B|nr:hypothetical protein [Rhodoblastus sp.]